MSEHDEVDQRQRPPTTPVVGWGVKVGETVKSVRPLRLLQDRFGRTWVAVFPPDDEPSGGVMAHLLPGESVEVVATTADGVTLRIPSHGDHESELLVPAYLVVASALPASWAT
jgi:hypothetical protein